MIVNNDVMIPAHDMQEELFEEIEGFSVLHTKIKTLGEELVQGKIRIEGTLLRPQVEFIIGKKVLIKSGFAIKDRVHIFRSQTDEKCFLIKKAHAKRDSLLFNENRILRILVPGLSYQESDLKRHNLDFTYKLGGILVFL